MYNEVYDRRTERCRTACPIAVGFIIHYTSLHYTFTSAQPSLFIIHCTFTKKWRSNLPTSARKFDFPIRIFSLKKAFTPSHNACFLLIFSYFKCEGFVFQVFTAIRAWMLIFSWFRGAFPVWRLGISTLHNRSPPVWMLCCPCEHFEIQAFTL